MLEGFPEFSKAYDYCFRRAILFPSIIVMIITIIIIVIIMESYWRSVPLYAIQHSFHFSLDGSLSLSLEQMWSDIKLS